MTMRYEDFVKQLEDENRPAAEVEALRGYLNKRGELASPNVAGAQLASYIVEKEDDVESGVLRLWSYFFRGAVQLPQEQDRLVELLDALKNLPESMSMRDGKTLNGEWSAGMELWKGLPQFRWELRERWNYIDPESSDPEQTKKREDWKHLNSFVARLTATGVVPILQYGEWNLATALENAPWDDEWELVENVPTYPRERQIHRHSVQKLDGDVPAAAQWIFYAADALREKHAKAPPREMETKYVGKLWTEARLQHGLSKSRWEFWKERFEWVASSEELQEATRKIAAEAAAKMA